MQTLDFGLWTWTLNPTHGSSLAGWIMARGSRHGAQGLSNRVKSSKCGTSHFPSFYVNQIIRSISEDDVCTANATQTHAQDTNSPKNMLLSMTPQTQGSVCPLGCPARLCVCVSMGSSLGMSHTLFTRVCVCVCSAGVRLSVCVSCLQPLPFTAGTLL